MRIVLSVILLFYISIAVAQNTNEQIEINFVSINNTALNVTVNWNHYSDLSQIDGYIIYQYAQRYGVWGLDTLTAVYVGKINQWSFSFDKVRTEPVKFAVVAYSGVPGNATTRTAYKAPHQTIYNQLQYDSCSSVITLKWNKYIGWGGAIADYKVFDSVTGQQIGVVPASDTTFAIPNVQTNQWYSYYVLASHTNGLYTSTSNIDSIYTQTMNAPAFIIARDVNITQNAKSEITFYIDPASQLHNFRLLSSDRPDGGYTVVREYSNHYADILMASDSSIQQSNTYYKLVSLNHCSAVTTISNVATLIMPEFSLTVQEVSLSWNSYQLWPDGVSEYRIFRIIGSEAATQIGVSNNLVRQFNDDISNLAGQQLPGNICYYIETVSNPDASGNSHSARSFSVCIDVTSQIFIPKAFTPNGDGRNDEFKPFFAFLPTDYAMVIFNRNGSKVFETSTITEGWNGIVKSGVKAPEGAYIYFITFTTSTGSKFEKKGNFTLIYP